MSYFHCIDIDGINVAIKVEEIDPVTPISQADFVTGDVTNPLIGQQDVFIYQYDGTASNGSTDGDMIGVDDDVISFKAELLMESDAVSQSHLPEEITPFTTTDSTTTVIGSLPIRENISCLIAFRVHAVRTAGGTIITAFWEYRYSFVRETAGSLTLEMEKLIVMDRPGGMDAKLITSSNNIHVEVTGVDDETWRWDITLFEYDFLEIT